MNKAMMRFCVLRSERGRSGMGGLWSDEPGLAGEKFLHHGLLEGAGFVAALFERGEFVSITVRTSAMADCST